ncbi:hypothetical protein K456DRAFT_1835003 [Colletotrichum gloeosporioides 23]|nr:hypothetical protein K456DRAFT_1835003 [Colletotrichum gloeosporioides 23]
MAGTEYQHNSSGPGDQFIAAGPQNNNSGSGTQYNAHNINFNARTSAKFSLWVVEVDKLINDSPSQLKIATQVFSPTYALPILATTKIASSTPRADYSATHIVGSWRILTSYSNGTFLWVSIVAQRLGDRKLPRRHTLTTLKEHPQGLDALYGRMLDQVFESTDMDLHKKVLAVVLITFRPLHLKKLATLVQPPLDDELLTEIIGECGSLLVLRDNTVYLVHQSAKDFLLKHSLDRIMPLGIAHQHTLLFSNSLRPMSTALRQNMQNLKPGQGHIFKRHTPSPDLLVPIRYPCVNWAQHLSQGLPPTAQEFDEVHAFLTEHYLHWLEAISFMQSMGDGMACIHEPKRLILVCL